MKPFNFAEAKSGKPVCTRDGRAVNIIKFNLNSEFPIVAVIRDKGGAEHIETYTKEGKYSGNKSVECEHDLMICSLPYKGWINVYYMNGKYKVDPCIFPTKEAAESHILDSHVDTIPIEFNL